MKTIQKRFVDPIEPLRILFSIKTYSCRWDLRGLSLNSIFRYAVQDVKGKQIRSWYETLTIKELTNLTDNTFQWKLYLKGLLEEISNKTVSDDTIVGLNMPREFLAHMGAILKIYTSKTLANYFAWTLLKKLSPALPDVYFNAYHKIDTTSSIRTKGQERWRACLKDTEANMPLTSSLMFVKKTVTDRKRNKTLRLFKEIRKAFLEGINSIHWLDKKTRIAVKLKMKNMINVISNPGFIQDKEALERKYAQVKSSSRPSDIAAFFISCQRNLVRENIHLLDFPATRSEWDPLPLALYEVNALYVRTRNKMIILAGIMQQPFLYENAPKYINFAKLGAIIGHEILHGFDSNGRYFDERGNIAPWWTQSSNAAFNQNAQCLIKQYNAYQYGEKRTWWLGGTTKLYVNGKRTLAENIADNGGLKYAYKAYKMSSSSKTSEVKSSAFSLNGDQMFFLSYAQLWCQAVSMNWKNYLVTRGKHTPNKYRVIGSLSNMKEFSKAFNCPVGSKMNPANRCEFW